MKLENALKKLNKLGHPAQKQSDQTYFSKFNDYVLTFMVNGREEPGCEICCINTRHVKDETDLLTDYFAGSYHRSLNKALKFLERSR